ncbi:MAG: DUF1203 domain-containing protein [Rhodobacteraceae bacterium]|nr:DUF1203 domain-containing protein [Paracoccaceae bacterium]
MNFRIEALSPDQFRALFDLSDEELAARNACRRIAVDSSGAPCRVSLEAAEEGEELILLHSAHQTVASPYRASHAIYVRRDVEQAQPAINEVPKVILSRLISLRGFDAAGMMIHAEVTEGENVPATLATILEDPAVEYVHLHFAKAGCFAASAKRAA